MGWQDDPIITQAPRPAWMDDPIIGPAPGGEQPYNPQEIPPPEMMGQPSDQMGQWQQQINSDVDTNLAAQDQARQQRMGADVQQQNAERYVEGIPAFPQEPMLQNDTTAIYDARRKYLAHQQPPMDQLNPAWQRHFQQQIAERSGTFPTLGVDADTAAKNFAMKVPAEAFNMADYAGRMLVHGAERLGQAVFHPTQNPAEHPSQNGPGMEGYNKFKNTVDQTIEQYSQPPATAGAKAVEMGAGLAQMSGEAAIAPELVFADVGSKIYNASRRAVIQSGGDPDTDEGERLIHSGMQGAWAALATRFGGKGNFLAQTGKAAASGVAIEAGSQAIGHAMQDEPIDFERILESGVLMSAIHAGIHGAKMGMDRLTQPRPQGVQHAPPVRENARQVYEPGIDPQSSPGESGQDLQQPPPEQPRGEIFGAAPEPLPQQEEVTPLAPPNWDELSYKELKQAAQDKGIKTIPLKRTELVAMLKGEPAPESVPKKPNEGISERRKQLMNQLRDVLVQEHGPGISELPPGHPLAIQTARGEVGPGALITPETAVRMAAEAPEGHPAKLILHNLRELEKNPRGTKFVKVNTNEVADGSRVVVNDQSKPLTIERDMGRVVNDITAELPEGGMDLYGKKVLPPVDTAPTEFHQPENRDAARQAEIEADPSIARLQDEMGMGRGEAMDFLLRTAKSEVRLPQWMREMLVDSGKNPDRMFNDIDMTRPQLVEQLANDPVTKFLERVNPALAERAKRGDLSSDEYQSALKTMKAEPQSAANPETGIFGQPEYFKDTGTQQPLFHEPKAAEPIAKSAEDLRIEKKFAEGAKATPSMFEATAPNPNEVRPQQGGEQNKPQQAEHGESVFAKGDSVRYPDPADKSSTITGTVEKASSDGKLLVVKQADGLTRTIRTERTKVEKYSQGAPPLEGGAAPAIRYADAIFRADKPESVKQEGSILGNVTDKLKAAAWHIRDSAYRFSGKMLPSTTRLAEGSGEAASRFVASKAYAKASAPVVAREVLAPDGGKVDPKLDKRVGAVLVEDNLRSIQDDFTKQMNEAKKAGNDEEALRLFHAAEDVGTIVGAKDSPFATEAEYQAAVKAHADVIERYQQWFAGEPESAYRVSQNIKAEEELPSRGQQTGARVNLIAIQPGEPAGNAVYTSPRGNPTNPLKKASPFARAAKGTGQGYEISLERMIENTLGKGTEIANEHRMYNQLVKDGLAVYGRPGQHPKIAGKPTVRIDTKRSTIITGSGNFAKNESLYVRADVYPEIRQALNIDSPLYSKTIETAATAANQAALFSVGEASAHIANQISVAARTPGINPVSIFERAFHLLTSDLETKRQLADMAKIGALPEEREMTGAARYSPLRPMSKLIQFTDHVIRLTMDDAFTKAVDKGLTPDTETNRRDFINQLGQYNKRAQHKLIELARNLGTGPFATAGANFYSMGLKNLTLSPGLQATSVAAAIKLRGMVLARFAAALGAVGLYNYLKWGRVDGGNNVPIGAMRLPNDKDGKTRYFDVLALLNITRGLRSVGAKAFIEGKRQDQTPGEIFDAGFRDFRNAVAAPFEGPLVQSAEIVGTGKNAAGYQVADIAEPGKSQAVENIKAAGKQFNQLVGLAFDKKTEGFGGAVNKQLGKFGVKTVGKEQSQAAMLASQLLARPSEPQTAEQKQRHEQRREAIKQIRVNPDYQIPEGSAIPQQEYRDVYREANMIPIAENVSQLPIEQAMRVWRADMSQEERDAVRRVIFKKLRNKLLVISPQERQRDIEELSK